MDHELFRRISHLKTVIELYELTPDKMEFSVKDDNFVSRRSLLPGLKDDLHLLETKGLPPFGDSNIVGQIGPVK